MRERSPVSSAGVVRCVSCSQALTPLAQTSETFNHLVLQYPPCACALVIAAKAHKIQSYY